MKKLLLPIVCVILVSCTSKEDLIKEEFGKLSFSILPSKPRFDTVSTVALACILRNHSDDTVYFMLSSCSGIGPYVECDYNTFTPRILYCNVSYFEPYALGPKETYPFYLELTKIKAAKELRLSLDLNFSPNKRIFPPLEEGHNWEEVDSYHDIAYLWSNKINVEKVTSLK